MEHEISLYIPTGVKAQNELFNGFGRRELLQSAVGSLLGGGVATLLWLVRECGADRCSGPDRDFRQRDDVYQRPEQSKRGGPDREHRAVWPQPADLPLPDVGRVGRRNETVLRR